MPCLASIQYCAVLVSEVNAPPPAAPQVGEAGTQQNKLNLDAVGQVDGVPIYDYDVEAADKPWRQPGAYVCMYVNVA